MITAAAGTSTAAAAAWAGVGVAFLAILLSAGAMLVRGARRDGRVDEVLERLTGIAEDHEERLRLVEDRRLKGQPPARRGGRG